MGFVCLEKCANVRNGEWLDKVSEEDDKTHIKSYEF